MEGWQAEPVRDEAPPPQAGVGFLLAWVAVGVAVCWAACTVVAFAVFFSLGERLDEPGLRLWDALRGGMLVTVVKYAVPGLLMGAAQWPLLRGRIRWAVLWIPASMLGWALGMLVVGVLSFVERFFASSAGVVLGGAAFGVVLGWGIGTGQHVLLAWQLYRARWWRLASVVGWGLIGAAVGVMPPSGGIPAIWLDFIAVIMASALTWAITGGVLVWALRGPRDSALTGILGYLTESLKDGRWQKGRS